jgi:hypothetical protein
MQKHEFIENWCATLEKYLAKLVVHLVLHQSDELHLFLQAEVNFYLESQDPISFKD